MEQPQLLMMLQRNILDDLLHSIKIATRAVKLLFALRLGKSISISDARNLVIRGQELK